MAGVASAHQAATATREETSQQSAGRTRRTSAYLQRAQQGGTAAAAAAPAALDSLSRLQQLADASPRVAQLRRLRALADGRFAPIAQLAGDPDEEELIQGQFATAELPPQRQQTPRANNTGLPDQLKSGIESLSGLSMDDVRVHYNSPQPAQLNALAYAQGSDIHLAPGQQRHLPHEAWHVVQQVQGRVRPTLQMKEGVPVNDDVGLEREADVMGTKALERGHRVVLVHRSVSMPIEAAQPTDGDAMNTPDVSVASNHSAALTNGRGSAQWSENEVQTMADQCPDVALQRQVQAWGDGSERVGQLRAWQGVADERGVGGKRQALSLSLAPGHRDAMPAVQRRIRVDNLDDGEPFDPDVDYVQGHWGFNSAEKSVYRRWLRDVNDHHYATKAEIQAAIRRVVSQPFGTDIANGFKDPPEQIRIFKQALDAGYRVFDTAYTYETLESLWQAATELRIARDELTIVYKVKPANDATIDTALGALRQKPQSRVRDIGIAHAEKEKVSSRLQHARSAMGGDHPDVLMLHDLDGDDATIRATITQLAAEITAGRASRLGVSNATVIDLERWGQVAANLGAPIRVVQNRASPYHRDEEMVAYCAEHGIQYFAYGMMGSAQVGACAGVGDEGEGLPTQYLLARHDPRLKTLAAQARISEGELLLAWAQMRGIAPVTFTSRADQAKKNFERGATPLPPLITKALNEMFVSPSVEAQGAVDMMPETPLKALYQAYVDPTAWSIIDDLRGANGGDQLLTTVCTRISEAHAAGEKRTGALRNFALNLVRHVADIQSTIQRMQKERAAAQKRNEQARRERRDEEHVLVQYSTWKEALLPAFASLADAAGAPHVLEALMTWANRNCLLGHTMGHALVAWPEIALTPEPPQADAVVHEDAPHAPAEQVTVGYGDAELYDDSFLNFKDGEAEQLAVDAEVYYRSEKHKVVSNHPDRRELVLLKAPAALGK